MKQVSITHQGAKQSSATLNIHSQLKYFSDVSKIVLSWNLIGNKKTKKSEGWTFDKNMNYLEQSNYHKNWPKRREIIIPFEDRMF